MNKFIKSLLLSFSAMLFVITASAQVTTSALRGSVADQNGVAIPGATVAAVHTPSGTTYYAVANAEGSFVINGMRTGGPYSVEVSCLGYQTVTYTDITLQLANSYQLMANLAEDNEMLSEAIVVSTAASRLSNERAGAATNISNDQIISLPTVSRSIEDVTRLSPYGGNGMTFAGADGRTANFTVDGANFNNNFGLSDGLPGGGNPISLDAIEELQVVISPYDVRQTNFIGGGVNAITKSGTNTFKGSAYVYHQNENLQGDAVYGEQIAGARAVDRKTTYGVTLGGPIVKNKLFFFVNAEYVFTPTVVNRWRASEDGVADADNYLSRTTVSDLERAKNHVMEKYGYDTGSYTDFPANESNMKLLARIDWNINDNHKLALRYNYTMNTYWSSPNATSMDGGSRSSYARMSQYSMSFANSMYSMNNLVSTLSLDLNSRLSDNLSNQLLVTYSKLDDTRGSTSDEFPFIDILKDGENYMALGYELFTWNNAVHNTHFSVKDDLTYFAGNHKFTGGFNFEYQLADNAYMRNGTGYYRYNSLDDFINGATPEIVNLTYGYDGETNPAARVQFYKAGLYIQDEWQARDNFTLTAGLRLDGLFFDNQDLMTNKAILDIDYYDENGNVRNIDTGRWPDAKLTLSPRVGFSWNVFGNNSLTVRGGTGLFSGRLPLVFFTNMPTNSGMVQYQAQLNEDNLTEFLKAQGQPVSGNPMDVFQGGIVTATDKTTTQALLAKLAELGYPMSINPEDGTVPSTISAVDPNFRMPQVWKTSIALDYNFPTSFPFSVTGEFIYNKTINGVTISDWSMRNVAGFPRFNGVDNRPIYVDGQFRSGTPAFVLENTNKGYGYSASVSLNMQPVEGLNIMAAYTHTMNKEITGMPGSNAESAFTYVPTVEGPNYIRLHNSQYVTPDRFVASLNHSDKSGNHFSLIYETWRGGYSYSYMTTNDMNGDGYTYDAIYIPTDEQVANNEFRFASADDAERFLAYVHKDPYLSKHQGEYAEPYSLYSPWVHRLDFSYKHDFKVKIGNTTNTLQLSLDIKNLLNLFNSSWGVSKYLNPAIGDEARILTYNGMDDEGYAVFSTPAAINGSTETFTPNHSLGQCWYASIGIKYMFN